MSRLGRNFRRKTKANVSNQPSFFAPLTHNLLLTKGQGVATFNRATNATCWCYLENAVAGDSQVLQLIPSGIPRFEGARFIASNSTWSNLLADGSAIPEATLKGVSIEVESMNLFLHSESLTTQNIATTTQSYTISFYGTGTVTLSGTATGSLVGTGANNRVSLTVTATAGTLTATVFGTCTKGQCEEKLMATSYIPTTTTTVTRNADVLTFPNAGNVSDTAGTMLMEVTPAFDIPNDTRAGYGTNYLIEFGVSNGKVFVANNNLYSYDGTNLVSTPVWTPLKDITYKFGYRWGSAGQRNWLNGSPGTNGSFDGSINSGTNMTVGGRIGVTNTNSGMRIKNLKIYKKALSDSYIQTL